MRTFIALELPDQFIYETSVLARRLSSAIEGRFMRPESYHLTLAFLGDTSASDIEAAIDAIDAACLSKSPIRVASDGLGKFGKSHDATLWLGLACNDALNELAESVRAELSTRGVAFDAKSFKPHITLARRARVPRGDLPPIIFPDKAFADTITLFKSELSCEGATYKPLYTLKMGSEI